MNKIEILEKYNISEATLRNWNKLKYINDINNIQSYEIDNILKNKSGVRRNKRTLQNNVIPVSYVEDKNIIPIIEKILKIKEKYNVSAYNILYETIINILKNNNQRIPEELSRVLGERFYSKEFIKDFQNIEIKYDERNDFLGCLYMSLISVGEKDVNGIYYTPFNAADRIIQSIKFNQNERIIDPACGSGNFLIQTFNILKHNKIPTETIIENLYGYDVDSVACLLAKINLYILDKNIDYEKINIYCLDFLTHNFDLKFDIVIGNPPWGKKYTAQEKKKLKAYHNLEFSKLDSFSQFILCSFELLNEGGTLSFILPSSILNIATHEYIRKFLLLNKIIYIKSIGRKFEEIVTDVVLLQVKKERPNNNICEFNNIKIDQNYFSNNAYSNFLVIDKNAIQIIDKLKKYNCYHLVDKIDYALGIVTGNNKQYVSTEQKSNYEPIISGKDFSKYKIDYSKVKNFIEFKKENFQQVANENFYRCKNKIIYKFIGKRLCFSVETKGMLTLNSANMICFPNNANINYVSAILNSRITQLYFDECYDTHKVLKNHIQSFYIPKFPSDVIDKITLLLENSDISISYNEDVENIIYSALKLSQNDINYLKERYK